MSLWLALALFAGGFALAVAIYPDEVSKTSVDVMEARIDPDSNVLRLNVGSCNGAPRVRFNRSSAQFEVEVTAYVERSGSDDCQDVVEAGIPQQFREPLPTELLDIHSGEMVPIAISADGN